MEEDYRGEVIGIAVEPCAGSICALRIALTLAFGIKEEVEIVDFTGTVLQGCIIMLKQRAGNDNLVKEVPLALVGERAYTFVEHSPPGIEETMRAHIFLVLLRSESHGT